MLNRRGTSLSDMVGGLAARWHVDQAKPRRHGRPTGSRRLAVLLCAALMGLIGMRFWGESPTPAAARPTTQQANLLGSVNNVYIEDYPLFAAPAALSNLPLPAAYTAKGDSLASSTAAQEANTESLLAAIRTSRAAAGAADGCPAAAATYVAMYSSYIDQEAKVEDLQQHALELSANFKTKVLIHAGMPASAVNPLRQMFGSIVAAETVSELQEALRVTDKPAFFLFGPLRDVKHGHEDLTLARLTVVFTSGWAQSRQSVVIIEDTKSLTGYGSNICDAIVPTKCRPSWAQLREALCALAPEMNSEVFQGRARVYPQVATGFQPLVPPKVIPASLWHSYTLGGTVSVGSWVIDESSEATTDPDTGLLTVSPKIKTVVWDAAKIASFEALAKARHANYYGEVDIRLYKLLDRHAGAIKGHRAAVMGSLEPWYEIVAWTYGAKEVLTVEYGPRQVEDPRYKVVTPAQFKQMNTQYDVAFVISSFEHDGEYRKRHKDSTSARVECRAEPYSGTLVYLPRISLLLPRPTNSICRPGPLRRPSRWARRPQVNGLHAGPRGGAGRLLVHRIPHRARQHCVQRAPRVRPQAHSADVRWLGVGRQRGLGRCHHARGRWLELPAHLLSAAARESGRDARLQRAWLRLRQGTAAIPHLSFRPCCSCHVPRPRMIRESSVLQTAGLG